jgi:hypothetical protein
MNVDDLNLIVAASGTICCVYNLNDGNLLHSWSSDVEGKERSETFSCVKTDNELIFSAAGTTIKVMSGGFFVFFWL